MRVREFLALHEKQKKTHEEIKDAYKEAINTKKDLVASLMKRQESLETQIEIFQRTMGHYEKIMSLHHLDGSLKQSTINLFASIFLFLIAVKNSLGKLLKK